MPFAQLDESLIDKNGRAISLVSPLKLHIGGKEKRDDWHIFDGIDGEVVNFVGDCSDLSRFPKASCAEIYCSHVLEHMSHNNELLQTLRGFHRVLHPNGKLMISVPDLDVLCRLFTKPELDIEQRRFVMRMMFGGQTDDYDFHKTGFNFVLLQETLVAAGFSKATQIKSFGLFTDSSELVYLNEAISLNVIAVP
ncbi:MAG: methyltransferase domain-containing protein [Rhodospirillaceae bacterium]|nr:methyltransferase domain-containing protein [Rhodospirillaceae bacterium]